MSASEPEGSSPTKTGPSPMARRRRALVGVLAASVGAALVGLTAPLWIRSPQQLAAEAKPPPSTVLTAPVEQRQLRDTVVVRGVVTPNHIYQVAWASRTSDRAIVTAVKVNQGDQISEGTILLEVNGRPLMVLAGATPAFRDLKPGATGKDVAQLQKALLSLGFRAGEVDGTFGPGTKRALSAFYASRGYEPLPVGPDDAQRLDAARRQVTAAQRQVVDTKSGLATVESDPLATAEQRARAATAVTRAHEDLATAQRSLADLERVTGPMLPLGEYTFIPSLPVRVDTLNAAVGAEASAPLVTLSAGAVVVTAAITEAQRPLCKPGAAVEIVGDSGLAAKGIVTSIAAQPAATGGSTGASNAAAPPGYPMVVTPGTALDPGRTGQNVRLIVEIATSDGEALVVPISALYAAADGQTYVTRRSHDGRETRIAVEPHMNAQGYVAVTVVDGELNVGDLVTIGAGPP